jgi:RNA polymerase sigma-70 factor (ECF subfamily)
MPHLDDALSLARWLTGNGTDAEDVVQESCIRAFGALATIRDHNHRAWLLAIVRNTCFTWLAKNRPKTLVVIDDENVFNEAREAAGEDPGMRSPEAALLARSEQDLIQTAINALPLAYREALVLREIEELSYREISQILAVPIGTVMSRIARARALLIQNLNRMETGKAGIR